MHVCSIGWRSALLAGCIFPRSASTSSFVLNNGKHLNQVVHILPAFQSINWTHYHARFASTSSPATHNTSTGNEQQKSATYASLEGRYATALFNVALASNNLETVYTNLEALHSAIRISNALKIFFTTSPSTLSPDSVDKVISSLTTEFSWNDISANFLLLLFANKRSYLFGDIFKSFQKMYRQHKGLKFCRVSTAQELSQARKDDVLKALKRRLGKDNELIVEFGVSPAIVAGLIVSIDDLVVDFSVSSRIDRMQSALMLSSM